jgi:hypothetical protein
MVNIFLKIMKCSWQVGINNKYILKDRFYKFYLYFFSLKITLVKESGVFILIPKAFGMRNAGNFTFCILEQ